MEQISDQITQGELKTGEQLPTVRELAKQLQVNFNTVARAYRLLDQAGFITTQHGRGTYILPQEILIATERSMALNQRMEEFLRDLEDKGYTSSEILTVFHRHLRKMKDE